MYVCVVVLRGGLVVGMVAGYLAVPTTGGLE